MSTPARFGVVLFPGWEVLDVFGPVEAFNMLARGPLPNATMAILAETMNPVPAMEEGSKMQQTVVPTHTFSNAPDLDVILVPGGLGTRNLERTQSAVDYIRSCYPRLHSVITVCTGSALAARAGILDNRRATTNKASWNTITAMGPRTHWVADARWVQDGNIWSTSGVSAGTDGALAWISSVYGEEVTETICNRMEYNRAKDAGDDPFSKLYGVKDVTPLE